MNRVDGRIAVLGAFLASLFAFVAFVAFTALPAGSAAAEGRVVLIGTTNALKDSGVVDFLLEGFVEKSGFSVRVSAREIGAVVVKARKGEVDVVLSDSPSAEEALQKEGAVTRRTPFMESRFVLVGPKADPAHIAGVAKPEAALGQILRFHSPFVTRGDDSTAHVRERLAVRYALTSAEIRVALGIGRGLAPKEIALEVGSSWYTVRAQLRHVFAKTERRTQSSLARLVTLLEAEVARERATLPTWR